MSGLRQECDSLFDLIAIQLSTLKKISPKHFYREEPVSSIPVPRGMESDLNNLMKKIRGFANDHGIGISRLLVQYGLPKNCTRSLLHTWSLKSDFRAIYESLRRLTREISQDDLTKFMAGHPMVESLNNNVEETGFLILPRLQAMNEPIQAGTEPPKAPKADKIADGEDVYVWAEDRIHLQFKNIYFAEKEKLMTKSGRQFRVENHIINKGWHKTSMDQLIIAACPISRGDLLKSSVEKGRREDAEAVVQHFFKIDGLKRKRLIHSRIEAAYLSVCEKKADIFMLPEMLADVEILGREFWDKLNDKADDAGFAQKPALLLTPSWWHDFTNTLRVYDHGIEVLFDQQKQFPFDYDKSYKKGKLHVTEDLRSPDSTIHILHIPGVGRLMIPICKDFLINDYRDILLRELGATMLLIPSFSFGSTQFNVSVLEAMQYGCYEIWLNSCAALWNTSPPEYIGIATSPFPSANQGRWFCHMEPQCGGNCGGKHDACLFIVTINLDEGRAMTCEHAAYPI